MNILLLCICINGSCGIVSIKLPEKPISFELKNVAISNDVHVFYYPWYLNASFDEKWRHWDDFGIRNKFITPSEYIASCYYPKLGPYSSNDPELIDQHMSWISQAGIGVVVTSWWGRGDYTEKPITTILEAAQKYNLKVAFHIEPYEEVSIRDSVKTIINDIQYIYDKYENYPAFYRVSRPTKYGTSLEARGVFYIFKPFDKIDDVEWKDALDNIRGTSYDAIIIAQTADSHHIDTCHFDGIYTYDICGVNTDHFIYLKNQVTSLNSIFVPSVGPGFIDIRLPFGKLENIRRRKNGEFYDKMWESALEVNYEWITITSFNEWHEGTQIEPAVKKDWNPTKFVYFNYNGAYGLYGADAEMAYINRTAYWIDKYNTITN